MRVVALASALLMCSQTVSFGQQAPITSGNELWEICQGTDPARQGYCIGYVIGAIEGMKWGIASPLLQNGMDATEANSTTKVLLGFCLPEGATYGQFVDVVKGYLARNPEKRHIAARIIVQMSLAEAFPCQA